MSIGFDVDALLYRIKYNENVTTNASSMRVAHVPSQDRLRLDYGYTATYRRDIGAVYELDKGSVKTTPKNSTNQADIMSHIQRMYKLDNDKIVKYNMFTVDLKAPDYRQPLQLSDFNSSGNITVTFKQPRKSLDACQGDLGGGMDNDGPTVDKELEEDAHQRVGGDSKPGNALDAFTDLGFWPWNWSIFKAKSPQEIQREKDEADERKRKYDEEFDDSTYEPRI